MSAVAFAGWRFERRPTRSRAAWALALLAAALGAVAVCSLLFVAAGASPAEAFRALAKGAFGSTRATAETLVKAILWVEQDASELPTEEDAWYDHQLVGLAVLRDGVRVGTVIRIDHLPAQDLLTVKTADGEVLVPFVKAIVPVVDTAAGTLTVTPPPGLFEQLDDEPEVETPDPDNLS